MNVDATTSLAGPGSAMPSPGTTTVSRKVPVILALLTVLGPA